MTGVKEARKRRGDLSARVAQLEAELWAMRYQRDSAKELGAEQRDYWMRAHAEAAAERDEARAERDALRAAIERVRAEAERWKSDYYYTPCREAVLDALDGT